MLMMTLALALVVLSLALAFTIVLGLGIAVARSAGQWWARRTPLGLVNHELARARERRRRERP